MASTQTNSSPPLKPTLPDPMLTTKSTKQQMTDKKLAKYEQKQQKQVRKETQKKRKHPAERYIVEAAAIIAAFCILCVIGLVFTLNNKHDNDMRESTRNTAEQVLRARFTDASINPPIEVVKVEWSGNDLAVTYVQGKQTCFGKVILPTEGQQYGISEINEVYPQDREREKYYCTSVSASHGLSPLPAGSLTTQ